MATQIVNDGFRSPMGRQALGGLIHQINGSGGPLSVFNINKPNGWSH